MLYTTFSLLASIDFIKVCLFNFETTIYKQKEYIPLTSLRIVSFIVATGCLLFANPLVIAQTTSVTAPDSSRVLSKAKNKNILDWGYRRGDKPVSYEDTITEKPKGLCADLIILLKNYLKKQNLVDNKFEIITDWVDYENRFEKTKAIPNLTKETRNYPEFDIECGADTIQSIEGITFSKPFAKTDTKILILKSKESFFKNIFDSNIISTQSVNLGLIENSISKKEFLTIFQIPILVSSQI
ncbi:hypothetical protein [Nostoc sp.]|uniref:hypothetical protein n=1 Tax=Nostoc sp. TaxID=1180 RepID=UPI002FF54F8C